MLRSRIIVLLMPILMVGSLNAWDQVAVAKYLQPYLEDEASKKESWEWGQAGQGGYLFRRFRDVTGDGRDELFLASSLVTPGNNVVWKVFSLQKDGVFLPYDGVVNFHCGGTWIEKEGGKTVLCSLGPPSEEVQRSLAQEDWIYPLYKYSFEFPRILESESELPPDKAKKIEAGLGDSLQDCEVVLLSDYLGNPNVAWKGSDSGALRGNDYFQVSGDEDRIAANAWFTPQVALGMLEKLNRGNEKRIPLGRKVEPKVGSSSDLSMESGKHVQSIGKGLSVGKLIAGMGAIVIILFLWMRLRCRAG